MAILALVTSALAPAVAAPQRLQPAGFRAPASPARLATSVGPMSDEPETKAPDGKQIVIGYMGAVIVGFLAWRAFDEPAGQHSRVKDDWATHRTRTPRLE